MLLKNANIYDVRAGAFKLGHLFIENGRIADMGFDGSPQSDAIDMEASYVLPGFIDCHVHLWVWIPITRIIPAFGQAQNRARSHFRRLGPPIGRCCVA